MALPKLDTPIYEIQLETLPQPIIYRPFLVKEEKILLTAMEGQDTKSMSKAIKQILTNCTLEPTDLDIDSLPSFDIEYYFLNLRARSVSEDIKILLSHPPKENGNNEETCTFQQEVHINIDDIKLTKHDDHTNKIMLTDKVGVVLNYPNMSSAFDTAGNNTDAIFKLIISSIDSIFDGEEVYLAKDTKKAELEEFVLSLNQSQFAKLMNFYQTMPKLEHDINYTCSKCGLEENIKLEGLQSFFN